MNGVECEIEKPRVFGVAVDERGRLAGVLLDVDRYGELIERLEFLEDSLAVLQARDERETAVPWAAVRE